MSYSINKLGYVSLFAVASILTIVFSVTMGDIAVTSSSSAQFGNIASTLGVSQVTAASILNKIYAGITAAQIAGYVMAATGVGFIGAAAIQGVKFLIKGLAKNKAKAL